MNWQGIGYRIRVHIDHVGIVGTDLARLIDAYKRLGFHVTPSQELLGKDADGHDQPLGQQSAHIMFADTYIELTAPTGTNPANHLYPYLEHHEGMHILALASEDCTHTHTRTLEAGLHPSSIQEASREVIYGTPGQARFEWFGFAPDDFPEGLVCYVEHLTPDIVFQKDVMSHANGASALRSVLVAHTEDRAQHYPGDDNTDTTLVIAQSQDIESAYPGSVNITGPYLAGLLIAVDDIDITKKHFKSQHIPYSESSNTEIWLDAEFSGGPLLVFSQ